MKCDSLSSLLELGLDPLVVAGPLEHCLEDVKVTESAPLDVDLLLELGFNPLVVSGAPRHALAVLALMHFLSLDLT